MKRENISLLLYTLAHFAVDFACANLIFRISDSFSDAALLMLTYNFCAFALQLPLGVILDKLGRNALAAAIGCLLTGAAYLFGSVPMAAAVVCGLGNAAFHLGGGIGHVPIRRQLKGNAPHQIFALPAKVQDSGVGRFNDF